MSDRPPLTDKQRRLLLFLAAHVRDHQRPPAYREVMRQFGWESTQSVTCHLRAMVKKGYLTKEKGLARGFRIIDLDEPIRRAIDAYLTELQEAST